MNYEHIEHLGGIRIAAAMAPALMAVAKMKPDRLASPLPSPANRLPIDQNGFVFIVPVPSVPLLRSAVEDGMQRALADAVVVRWHPGARGRDLMTDVAVRSREGVCWYDNFRPWLCATTADLWLVPETSNDAVWFRLSSKGVCTAVNPPFKDDGDRRAGINRAQGEFFDQILLVLDADPIGASVSGSAN